MSKLSRTLKVSVWLLLGIGLVACGGSNSGSGVADSSEVSDGTGGEISDEAGGEVGDGTSGEVEDGAVGEVGDGAGSEVGDGAGGEVDDGAGGEVDDGTGGEVSSAGGSENTDSSGGTSSPAPGADQAPPIVSALEGTWSSGCFPFQGGGNEQSRLLTLAVEGSTSVSTMFSYSDLNCSVPVIPSIENGVAIESSMVNSVEFPEQTVTTSLGEASFINFTTVSMTVDGVTEILGSSTRFTIFLITDDGQLFFGAGGASNSPESRPQTLDLFFPLIRL